jgi:putative endonuclease
MPCSPHELFEKIMSNKKENKNKGDFGEGQACLYLTGKGYNIVARNYRDYRKGAGEIDIIAENSERLAFIEVKTRKLMGLGRPSDAVDFKKRSKIIKTARIYLASHESGKYIGFDIIEVVITDSLSPDVIEINHFEDAFDASAEKGRRVLFI